MFQPPIVLTAINGFAASPSTIVVGNSVNFNGVLLRLDTNTGLPNQTISILENGLRVFSTITNIDGGFTGTISFNVSGTYDLTAQFDGTLITPINQTHPVLNNMVYGFLIDNSGNWNNPEPPNVAIPAILNSGAMFVRAGNEVPPDAQNAPLLTQLINAGIRLGVNINTRDPATNTPKPISELVQQATLLKNSGFYDYVFLDFALVRPDIQDVVDALKQAGWSKIMTNDSAFDQPNRRQALPPVGIWAHAKAFDILRTDDFIQRAATQPAIQQPDIDFINYIKTHDPGSTPVLKLEVAAETSRFSQLSLDAQKNLLSQWAKGQQQYGYRIIYPLFTGTGRGSVGSYDSITAGTYDLQVSLIKQYG